MPMPRQELARRRRARGYTQEAIAHRLGVDVSTVARWERGIATPTPAARSGLAGALALSLDDLDRLLHPSGTDRGNSEIPGATGFIPGQWDAEDIDALAASLTSHHVPEPAHDLVARVTRQWLVTSSRGSSTNANRGDRIGMSTVRRVHDRIQALRHADDVLAGGDLHTIVRAELTKTARLLRSAHYTDLVGRRLLAEIAELCELAGWCTADAGNPIAAQHYYLRGVSAAHAADEPVLAAHLVTGLSYQLAESGDRSNAALLARSALARLDTGRARLTPTVAALFRARLAWAEAQVGNTAHAIDQMGRARESHENRASGDPDPSWVYWLSAGEMEIIAGRFDNAVGRPMLARQRLNRALAQCDPRYVREHTLYTTWLAEAHLCMREFDPAARLAERARDQDQTIASNFSHRAVTALTDRLSRCG